MNQRTNLILKYLSKNQRVEVAELARRLEVSQVTIRKDLDSLEKKGLVRREHGFASLLKSSDPGSRLALNYEAKQKIVKKAAEWVSDGDTLMIGGGSCCILLAEELVSAKKDLTLVTNSLFLAEYIRRKSASQVILLGGILQSEAQVLVGPLVLQTARNFYVDVLFTDCDGYCAASGFAGSDQLYVQAVKDMASQAEQVVVLAENDRFFRHSAIPFYMEDKIRAVITDVALPQETLSSLQTQAVRVITA